MITRKQIRWAVAALSQIDGEPVPPDCAEDQLAPLTREEWDEVRTRFVMAVCKFYLEDMPVSRIAYLSNVDEEFIQVVLDTHLADYLDLLEQEDPN